MVERSIFTKRYVGDGDYALDMGLLGTLKPFYVARVAGAVLRPVGFVLHQPGVLHSGKLAQQPARRPGRGPRPGISDCRGSFMSRYSSPSLWRLYKGAR